MKKLFLWLAVMPALLCQAQVAKAVSYSTQVLADNPIAYWRFEEMSGSTASDSASSHDGIYNNVALGQASAFPGLGNAGGFNGFNSYVSVPSIGSVNDLTIEAWVKAASLTCCGWVSLYNTEVWPVDSSHWQFYTNRFEWALDFADTDNSFMFNTNTWYHIVTTYQQSTGAGMLYVNGQFQELLFVVPGIQTTLSPGNIGSWLPSGGSELYTRFFDGRIDELAVYSAALSDDRIAAHYSAAAAAAVPEPGSLLLLGSGLAGLAAWRRVQKRA